MQLQSILCVAGLVATTNAHFLLNYPQTRGFDEDKEPNFCGGFGLASSRAQFPLSGGFVSITSEHPKADVDIIISFKANPTAFADFNKTASGTSIPFLLPFTQMNSGGDACFPVNVSALGLPDAKDGANATIQVQFNGGDGQLFQCSDVTLSSNFSVPSGTKCDNATGAFPSSTAPSSSGSSSGGAASPTGSSSTSSAIMLTTGATGLVGIVGGVVALLF